MNFEIPIPPELVDAIAELVAQRLRQLESRVCGGCGAKPVAVLWTPPRRRLTPELVMVERRR